MTRLSVSDLSPRMKAQLLKKLTEEERRELLSMKDDKKSKYHAEKMTVTLRNGETHTFDSKREWKRYNDLAMMEQAGEIQDLRLQVTFPLIPSIKRSDGKTERGISYRCDFMYQKNGQTIVEDTKGFRTKEYKIKKKLMLWIHHIEILET